MDGDEDEFKLKLKANGVLSGLDYLKKIWKYSFLLYKSHVDGMSGDELSRAQKEAAVFLENELNQGGINGSIRAEVEESMHFYESRQRLESPVKYIIKDISGWLRRR